MKLPCDNCEFRRPMVGGIPIFPTCLCCGRAISVAGELRDGVCQWCRNKCPKKEEAHE